MFISQTTEDCEILGLAITSANFLKIKYIAHKLKSSVQTVGLLILEQPLQERELQKTVAFHYKLYQKNGLEMIGMAGQ